MGFFDKVMEPFQDKTRDNICTGLQSMGIDAQIAERDRAEENIGCGYRIRSLGLIDTAEGPIRWVNVLRSVRSPNSGTVYYTDYGVPDPRLGPSMVGYIPNLQIKSDRIKTSPLFGKVIDLRWKSKDSDRGIIDRLNSDILIKHPIMESRDVRIRANGYPKCWIIEVETREVPSKELWNCYQAIAGHLLAEWSPA